MKLDIYIQNNMNKSNHHKTELAFIQISDLKDCLYI